MAYQIDDKVLYGGQVCTIAGTQEKEVGGKQMAYYVLHPVFDDKTVIYAPIDNPHTKAKMRQVLSTNEVLDLIGEMRTAETIWVENETQRREVYRDILSRGNRKELMQLIKSIYLHQKAQKEAGRKAHVTDERFLKDAEKILYDEFAHVLQLGQDEVLPFIEEQIEAEAKARS